MTTPSSLPQPFLHQARATLCGLLPPPNPDTPEHRAAHEETALAAIAALNPTTPFEVTLAAEIIGADAHAMQCLREAAQPDLDPDKVFRSRAQACAMMRQMLSLLRTLQRLQPAQDQPKPAAQPGPPTAPPPSKVDLHRLTEAERYAVTYPDRVARIRAAGGLPAQLDFTPPRRALVKELIRGTSTVFRVLDQYSPATAAG
jgi:hypothetical protein